SAAAFPRLAREKGSRPVVAAVVFSARSSPEFARFAFVPCLGSICLVFAAADPSSLFRSDLAAVVVSVGFAAGSVVVDVVAGVVLSVSVRRFNRSASYRRFYQLLRVDKVYYLACNVPYFANQCHA